METPSSNDPRAPRQGDVIEFSFLWKHEWTAGLLEGVKDRRRVIAALLEDGRRVVVMPITGTEPAHEHKIALSAGALGLLRRSWIVISELNIIPWPGHDLRPARRPTGAWRRYGRLSDPLRSRIADAMQALINSGRANVVVRT
jgi:hypothetical protein